MARNGFELGTAWVSIAPSMRGVTKQITSELAGVDVKAVGTKLGQELGGSIGKGLNLQAAGAKLTKFGDQAAAVGGKLTTHITMPALAAASAVAGIFVMKGWDRLVAIDTARAKLTALKMSAEDVDEVMSNALSSVRGTAFGLGEAATTAAGAVAAGIKPGRDLERVLRLVADTAAVAGIGMGEMGAIFNKVAADGKIQGDVIAQLGDRGVAILPALANHLGVATEEVRKLASEGKISFADFTEAMETAVGGAAVTMGELSLVAAWDNLWAAVGRVGAAFLDAGGDGEGFFSQVKPLLGELTDMVDDLTPKAEDLGVKFGETFGTVVEHIRDIIGWWSDLDPAVQRTIGVLSGIAISLGPALLIVGKIAGAVGGAITGIGTLMTAIGGVTAPAWLTGLFGGGAAAGTAAGATAVAGGAATTGGAAAAGGLMAKLATGAKALMGPWGLVIAGVTSMIALSPRLREALGGIFESLMSTLGKLWEGIQPVFDTLFGAFESVVGFLGPVLGFLGEVLGGVLQILSPFVEMLGAILVPVLRVLLLPLELFGRLIAGLVPSFGDLTGETEDLIGPIVEVAAAFTSMVSDTVIEWIDGTLVPAIDGIGIAFSGLIEWFGSLFGASDETSKEVARGWAELGQFFEDAWNNIVEVASWAWENVLKPIFDTISWVVTELLIPAFQMFWSVCEVVWLGISTVIGFVWNGILKPIFDLLAWIFVEILMPVFMAFWNVVSFVWTAISTAVMIAWGVLAQIFGAIVSVVSDTLGPIFSWLYDNIIKPVWTAISDKIGEVGDWFRTNIVPAFETATGFIGDAFDNLKRVIGEAWNAIKRAAVAPVNFVINTVYNDGIKAMFDDIAEAVGLDIRMPTATPIRLASGGVLPGYTPGRDVHKFYSPTAGMLHLSGGEGIIRPDALRALGGKEWLDRVNSARGDAYRVHAFADGGVWDWVGETFDGARAWFAEATDTVMSIISDPLGAIRNLILEPVKSLLSGMGGGLVGDILAGIPLQVVGWLEDLLKDNVAQSAVVDGYRGGPTLARLLPIIQKYGLVVTDTWGSPEHNAALGRSPTSYHGDWDNPAVDIAGPFSAMEAAAEEIIAMGGWRQILWKVAGHWDHIHVAREGGVWNPPSLYDNGGWLQPGLTMAYNATGRPEPVLTSEQWERVQGGVTIQQTNYLPVTDPNVVGDRLAAAAARGLVGVSA